MPRAGRKYAQKFTRIGRPRGTALERRVVKNEEVDLAELIADAERGIEYFLSRRPWLKSEEQWRAAKAANHDFIFAGNRRAAA